VGSRPLSDWHAIWGVEWYPERNHPCQISCWSVKGFLGGRTPKSAISYTYWNDPYNSQSCTTVQTVIAVILQNVKLESSHATSSLENRPHIFSSTCRGFKTSWIVNLGILPCAKHLLLARLMGQDCCARWRLSSSSVTLPAGRGGRARRQAANTARRASGVKSR